jgi:hypothetical protein
MKMKKLTTLLVLIVVALSFQCSSSDNSQSNDIITQQMLDAKKAEVITLINSSLCSGSCNYIAFGSKPCGGPKEYLLFSNSVNLAQLQLLVTQYNEMEHQFNLQTNAVSDCALVLPPNTVDCVNGTCVIIN